MTEKKDAPKARPDEQRDVNQTAFAIVKAVTEKTEDKGKRPQSESKE